MCCSGSVFVRRYVDRTATGREGQADESLIILSEHGQAANRRQAAQIGKKKDIENNADKKSVNAIFILTQV